MMRFPVPILLILCLILPLTACAQVELIEKVSAHYAAQHPGLESYRVGLKTNKLNEMLGRMTASMPPDVPRPDAPELIKFWDRKSGTHVRSSTVTAVPYMKQMVDRFSRQFAIDLGSLFLPAAKKAERAKLLKKAKIKSAESMVADTRIHHFDIEFAEPTDINGAFYGSSFSLPQGKISRLAFDIDPTRNILIHLDIEAEGKQPLAVEIRHLEVAGNVLPRELSITTPDGSIDEHFETTFVEVDGYHLPEKQLRKIRRPGLEEELMVEFSDYVINP